MAKTKALSEQSLSLEAVTAAVTAVMRASNPAGTADETMSARIGAIIRPQLAHALRGASVSGAGLTGQQAFRTILSQHLSGAAGDNDETRRAMRDYVLRHANRTGPEFAALVGQYLRGGGWNGQHASDARSDSAESASSAAYDKMGSVKDYSSPAGQAHMRNYAHARGVGWAGSHPELLRLGPAGIDALAQAHFKKETFIQMKQAGYGGQDAVLVSRFANEHGKDANAIGADAAKVTKALPQTEAETHRQAIRKFLGAKDEAAREAAGRELDDMHEGLSQSRPGMKGDVDRLQRSLGRKKTEDLKEEATADAKVVGANASSDEADALLASPVTSTPGKTTTELPKATDKAAVEPAKAPVKLTSAKPAP